MEEFQQRIPFHARLKESTKIRLLHVNQIPVIVHIENKKGEYKQKYIVNPDYTLSTFMSIIRKRESLRPHESFFVLISATTMPTISTTMLELYRQYSEMDGLLYITFMKESTFG